MYRSNLGNPLSSTVPERMSSSWIHDSEHWHPLSGGSIEELEPQLLVHFTNQLWIQVIACGTQSMTERISQLLSDSNWTFRPGASPSNLGYAPVKPATRTWTPPAEWRDVVSVLSASWASSAPESPLCHQYSIISAGNCGSTRANKV